MSKLWSISTTVRNPARLADFLRVLTRLEGTNFSIEEQKKYQILLIKERLYKPTNIPQEHRDLFADVTREISYDIARDVFIHQGYVDPAMRGRQSVNPLNKLGFSVAKESLGAVKITNLGNLLLAPDSDISYIIFKSLLKLQFPNPMSSQFSRYIGFNIRPFITLMHLMKRTNGLSQTEFSLFGPTLINFQDIAQYSEYVLKRRTLRGSGEKEAFDREFLMNFYQTESLTDTQRSNPFEYGDNSMRYFRLTRYFKVTKETLGHWRISLEPSRRSEIEQLLEVYDGSAVEFKNVDGYVDYLSDIESPELPWERYTEKSKEVIASLIDIVKVNYSELVSSLQQEVSGKYHTLVDHEMTGFNSEQAATLIEELRSFRRKIIDLNRSRKLKRNLQELRNIITIFQDRSQMRNVEPVEFEYMISQCLKILNDEIEIIPNCIVDDEGNPIGFAPGNKPDIEGYYESFNSIFEATLDVSRNQVYRESMPVMRHLRDFEIINPDKPSFCVFISPRAHRDTVNYFWYSVRNGFEGRRQNIIALDLNHFIEILKFFIEVLESGNQFTHHDLRTLLESIVAKANNNKSSTNWFGMTSEFIEEWKSSKE